MPAREAKRKSRKLFSFAKMAENIEVYSYTLKIICKGSF